MQSLGFPVFHGFFPKMQRSLVFTKVRPSQSEPRLGFLKGWNWTPGFGFLFGYLLKVRFLKETVQKLYKFEG